MKAILIKQLEINGLQQSEQVPIANIYLLEKSLYGILLKFKVTHSREESFTLATRLVTSFRIAKEGGIGYNQECDSSGPVPFEEYG